jgi:peroxiredoxin Q/BCP
MESGDVVSDFEVPDQSGAPWRLSTALGAGPVALFFYPAAMTAGCTKEACHFRDLGAEFAAAGAQRVGISRDDVAKQREFANLHGFDYPLLADLDGAVAEQFGVRRGSVGVRLGAPIQRATFVIGTDGRVVAAIRSEVNMTAHGDDALAALGPR